MPKKSQINEMGINVARIHLDYKTLNAKIIVQLMLCLELDNIVMN
jgi:hypothetical protein